MAPFTNVQPSSTRHNATLWSPRRPGWYISRGNGVFVPLIAADELPDHIRLHGVSKRMSPEELRQNGMQHSSEYMGEVIGDGATFPAVDEIAEKNAKLAKERLLSIDDGQGADQTMLPTVSFGNPDHGPNQTETAMVPCSASGHVGPAQTRSFSPAVGALSRASTMPNATHRPLPPSGQEPDASRKVYCTHWIRTGECDYMQQGCYYKHEMPDRATLEKIGFRTVPRWWQEHLASAPKTAPLLPEHRGLRGHEVLKGVWARGNNVTAPVREDDTANDSASSSELPLGNPDTTRWTRSWFPAQQPRALAKPPNKTHVFGKAQPPAFVPVCGRNPKAEPTMTRKATDAPLALTIRQAEKQPKEETDLITLNMSPLVPSPPQSQQPFPKTPANSTTSSGASSVSGVEQGSAISSKHAVPFSSGAVYSTTSSGSSPESPAPGLKGRGGGKSAMTLGLQKQRAQQHGKPQIEVGDKRKGKVRRRGAWSGGSGPGPKACS